MLRVFFPAACEGLKKHSCASSFSMKLFPQGFHRRTLVSKPAKPFKEYTFSCQIGEIFDQRIAVTLAQIDDGSSNRARSAQKSRRKEKERSQKRKDTTHGDAHNAKRQQNQPNNGINHQRKQRERPTEEKQDAPKEESDHGNPLTYYYVRARLEVPSIAKAFNLSLRAIETGTSAWSSM